MTKRKASQNPSNTKPTQSRAAAKRSSETPSASQLIEQRIRDLGGWRGKTLARMRALILAADPKMLEEVKWRKPSNAMAGVPVWSHDGIVCTGEAYAKVVKLTLAQGAKLPDPTGLFNASLDGNTRRAIDIHEGEEIDADAFQELIQAAVALNGTGKKQSGSATKSRTVKLLSGGNPQIAKGDGDAPVQAYLAAMPGWKSELGKRLDALIVQHVPDVRKAVRWNSPFYGVEDRGWFLSFHVLTRYVKVTFFSGLSLQPIPPGGTEKSKESRWIDIYEGAFDADQMARWIKQAAALPGWIP